MATCTLEYSVDVSRRAFRTYFWRRFKTPLGALYLGSFPIIIGGIWLAYCLNGPDGFVGAFGLLLFMNLVIQLSYYFSVPKAFVKRLSDPVNRTAEVETSAEGVHIAFGRSAALLKWSTFKQIWLYDDFVILAVRPPLLLRFTFLPAAGMSVEMRRDLEAAAHGRTIT